jgi:ATP diphosphatase
MEISDLVDLVARLRAPDGCPWDREQTLGDVRAYLLEEAHETAAAIDAGDSGELASELGDLLFQTAFVLRLAEEEGLFSQEEVLAGVRRKMVDRHPHVFEGSTLPDAASVRRAWEERKAAERGAGRSLLDGLPASLPALTAAFRLGQRAAGVGFDWPEPSDVLAKVEEELDELRASVAAEEDVARREEEIGDLLFALASLARQLGTDPEAALARANLKFRRRFAAMERALEQEGRSLSDCDLDELEALWQEVKVEEPPA